MSLQLRLDLAAPATAPAAADPEAMVRTLADLMLEALRPPAAEAPDAGGGDEHEVDA